MVAYITFIFAEHFIIFNWCLYNQRFDHNYDYNTNALF